RLRLAVLELLEREGRLLVDPFPGTGMSLWSALGRGLGGLALVLDERPHRGDLLLEGDDADEALRVVLVDHLGELTDQPDGTRHLLLGRGGGERRDGVGLPGGPGCGRRLRADRGRLGGVARVVRWDGGRGGCLLLLRRRS